MDHTLVFIVIFLVCFGTIMMYSATLYTYSFILKQAVFGIVGIVAMLLISWLVDYHWYQKFALPLLLIGIALMLLVFTPLAKQYNSSTRWVKIGPIGFQPAEVYKIAAILFNAAVLNKLGRNRVRELGTTIMLMAGACVEGALVLLITDNLSTGIIVIAIALCMILVMGPNRIYYVLGTLAVILIVLVVLYYSKLDLTPTEFENRPFRDQRILRWVQPEKYSFDGKNFQTLQSLYAIGSGSFGGKGIGNSTQKMILPEAMNDMIFAIVCEELGFVGATFLLVIFGVLMQRFLFIARNAKDLYGHLVVVGILSHIGVQVALNVAVATNLIPNTGVTLPFFSYGGTALLLLLAEMGIALNVSRQGKL